VPNIDFTAYSSNPALDGSLDTGKIHCGVVCAISGAICGVSPTIKNISGPGPLISFGFILGDFRYVVGVSIYVVAPTNPKDSRVCLREGFAINRSRGQGDNIVRYFVYRHAWVGR